MRQKLEGNCDACHDSVQVDDTAIQMGHVEQEQLFSEKYDIPKIKKINTDATHKPDISI